MKGQYLAVESVMTFGMGLVVAIGTISAFSGYKGEMMETARQQQVNAIESEVSAAVHALRPAESGNKQVDLPETLGGSDYEIALNGGVKIFVNNQEYFTELSDLESTYDFQGSASGGSVKVYKRGNQYTLRAN